MTYDLPPRDYLDLLYFLSDSAGENGDCAVIAIAMVTGELYATAQDTLRTMGRKKGQGSTLIQIASALHELGYKMVNHGMTCFLDIPMSGKYLVTTKDHIGAYIDGNLMDDIAIHSDQIESIYKVIPTNQ